MSALFGFTRSGPGLRPVAAAVLLTVGAAMGALGTMAAMGQAGVARASGHGPVHASARPAAGVAGQVPAGGFDGVDHSMPSAHDGQGNPRDADGESSPTF